MNRVKHIFIEILEKEFLANYASYTFFTERDIVWTLQKMLICHPELNINYNIFNDYGLLKSENKKYRIMLSCDLVIVNKENPSKVDLAIEFKFEPDHRRTDIPKTKFPVTSFHDIIKDIYRVKRMTMEGKSLCSIAIFIDENKNSIEKYRKNNIDPKVLQNDKADIYFIDI